MNRIYTAVAAMLLSATAIAQQATPLSLQECMDYAMKHNYTIRNAQLDVLIQQAQNSQTASAAYPHINGKAELDDYLNPQQSIIDGKYFGAPGTEQKIAFTLPYGASATLNGSQVLFDGSVLIALKARNTILESARLSGKVTEQTVHYNVYKSYNALVVAYKQYSLVRSSLAFTRSIAHDLDVTYQNGLAEKIDVERSTVQINNLASDSMRIANMLTISEQVLKYQIGMDINTPIVLTDTVLEQKGKDALQTLEVQEEYDRLPEYNLLTTALKLNDFNLQRYRLAGLPSLNAFGAMGYNYPNTRFTELFHFPNYLFNSVIGLQLNVPIFNGFMRTNQVWEAKLNIEKTKNNIDNLKLTLDFQTAQSRTNLRNAIIQTQTQHRNLDLSNDVLDLAQRKYKEGVGSNVEVTQAQTELLRSQNSYFSALLDLINAEADLKKALGLLK